ncbi:MAG: acyl-CoA dehydrogenase family protein [Candidatus Omnitrophica bacterium]|nr:acyl-CoA dehydrogenase family protein [Candidatus Omnitrophota bacterium]
MSLFDKNISEEKKKSLELAEDSRESEWKYPSFALKLFYGVPDWSLIFPFPRQSVEDKKEGDLFIAKLEKLLKEKLDPDEVDRTGIISDEVLKGLAEIGAFAIKIPKKYGGLGLSQINYIRAIHLVGSYCGSTAVLLSAHQSIGVPQPLKLFGTEEQKNKYFPQFAQGAISAFALTEAEAGSDPRNMTTTATPTEDGKYFLINGEKLWCTNGLIADVIVVMAVTPPKIVDGKERKQITAFIVETNSPGLENVHRCQFMGLHGIQNGLMRFRNVKVPRENIILGEGEGLKLALMTLNTGRLTLPGASTGIGKWCLNIARRWSKERKQWGAPIGEHESVAIKLGYIASHTFAMEAISWLTAAMADDQKKDIRLEAAIAKHFCTLHSWKIVDETLQIRAGQGYESASSLKARGMHPWAVERVMRDVRINMIIEGTSEIMHLFIAREALDPHLSRVKNLLMGKGGSAQKLKTILAILKYYAFWYPKLWIPSGLSGNLQNLPGSLTDHMRYVNQATRRLARYMFHQMMRYQQRLESKQMILNRIVDIGSELFAISTTCSYAASLHKEHPNAVELGDLFCQESRRRIEELFKVAPQTDKLNRAVAKKILKDEFVWLENDIIAPPEKDV